MLIRIKFHERYKKELTSCTPQRVRITTRRMKWRNSLAVVRSAVRIVPRRMDGLVGRTHHL